MPQIGLGSWGMDDAEAARVVRDAIAMGYRLIDTASHYRNEAGVGEALRTSGVPREELFVTSKLTAKSHSVEGVRRAFAASVRRLGVDHLDLFLIHWPNPTLNRYVDAWSGLVRLLESGDVGAIGVSNFEPPHLNRIVEATGVVPDVNQIQLSPWLPRPELRRHHAALGIVTEAWTPLAKGSLLTEPLLVEIAEQRGRSPAQVVLRWHHQLGAIPIPKSSHPQRMRDNLAIFDFELSDGDIERMSGLDRGGRPTWDPETYVL